MQALSTASKGGGRRRSRRSTRKMMYGGQPMPMGTPTSGMPSVPMLGGRRRSRSRRGMRKMMYGGQPMPMGTPTSGMPPEPMAGGRRRRTMRRKGNNNNANMMGGARMAVGSKLQVWHGTAAHTSGGLKKKDLMKHKGRIVSRKKHAAGKKAIKNLIKAGYKAKKGTFKLFRK